MEIWSNLVPRVAILFDGSNHDVPDGMVGIDGHGAGGGEEVSLVAGVAVHGDEPDIGEDSIHLVRCQGAVVLIKPYAMDGDHILQTPCGIDALSFGESSRCNEDFVILVVGSVGSAPSGPACLRCPPPPLNQI